MICFLIPLIHPENSVDYDNDWRMLQNTLFSITRQNNPNYHILVACNKVNEYRMNGIDFSKVTFIKVNTKPIKSVFGTSRLNDKFIKRQAAIKYASENIRPQYYYFMDSDDYLSFDLVDTVINSGIDIGYIDSGILINVYCQVYCDYDVSDFCGSTVFATSKETYRYFDNIRFLSLHGWKKDFKESRLLKCDTNLVAYNLHDNNVSKRAPFDLKEKFNILEQNALPLTQETIDRFALNLC